MRGRRAEEPKSRGGGPLGQSSALLLLCSAALRRIFGMPDYQAYCSHLRDRHPDRPIPSEREFFDEFLRARYGDGPTRCC
jgi:uncharacterized short protein YbdD (DUF466 family)